MPTNPYAPGGSMYIDPQNPYNLYGAAGLPTPPTWSNIFPAPPATPPVSGMGLQDAGALLDPAYYQLFASMQQFPQTLAAQLAMAQYGQQGDIYRAQLAAQSDAQRAAASIQAAQIAAQGGIAQQGISSSASVAMNDANIKRDAVLAQYGDQNAALRLQAELAQRGQLANQNMAWNIGQAAGSGDLRENIGVRLALHGGGAMPGAMSALSGLGDRLWVNTNPTVGTATMVAMPTTNWSMPTMPSFGGGGGGGGGSFGGGSISAPSMGNLNDIFSSILNSIPGGPPVIGYGAPTPPPNPGGRPAPSPTVDPKFIDPVTGNWKGKARGGIVRPGEGAIVGDSVSGRPTGFEEVIRPRGDGSVEVIPIGARMATGGLYDPYTPYPEPPVGTPPPGPVPPLVFPLDNYGNPMPFGSGGGGGYTGPRTRAQMGLPRGQAYNPAGSGGYQLPPPTNTPEGGYWQNNSNPPVNPTPEPAPTPTDTGSGATTTITTPDGTTVTTTNPGGVGGSPEAPLSDINTDPAVVAMRQGVFPGAGFGAGLGMPFGDAAVGIDPLPSLFQGAQTFNRMNPNDQTALSQLYEFLGLNPTLQQYQLNMADPSHRFNYRRALGLGGF